MQHPPPGTPEASILALLNEYNRRRDETMRTYFAFIGLFDTIWLDPSLSVQPFREAANADRNKALATLRDAPDMFGTLSPKFAPLHHSAFVSWISANQSKPTLATVATDYRCLHAIYGDVQRLGLQELAAYDTAYAIYRDDLMRDGRLGPILPDTLPQGASDHDRHSAPKPDRNR